MPRATDGNLRKTDVREFSRRSRAAKKSPAQLEFDWDKAALHIKPKPRTRYKHPDVRPVSGDVAGLRATPENRTEHAGCTRFLSISKHGFALYERITLERDITRVLPGSAIGNTHAATKGTLVATLIAFVHHHLIFTGIKGLAQELAVPVKSAAMWAARYLGIL